MQDGGLQNHRIRYTVVLRPVAKIAGLNLLELIKSKNESIQEVEACLRQLQTASAEIDFALPPRLRLHHFGGAAAFVQLLATWSRKCGAAKLIVDFDRTDPNPVQQLFGRTLPGTAAGLLVDPSRIANLDGTKIEYPKSPSEIAVEELMLRGTERTGPRLWLLCADHTTLEKPTSIYGSDGRVSLPALRFALSKFFSRPAPSSRGQTSPNDLRECASSVLFELLQNTHEWARTDWNNEVLNKSVRGTLIHAYATHEVPEDIANGTVGAPLIASYYQSFPNRLAMIEVSVFDCGPGLASRFLRKPLDKMTVAEEFDAIKRCLRLRGTSSDIEHKGLGLHRILRLLTRQRGIIRIRAGRLSLFRNLLAQPLTEEDSYELHDEKTGTTPSVPWPPVTGTLVTAIMPLDGHDPAQGKLWEGK